MSSPPDFRPVVGDTSALSPTYGPRVGDRSVPSRSFSQLSATIGSRSGNLAPASHHHQQTAPRRHQLGKRLSPARLWLTVEDRGEASRIDHRSSMWIVGEIALQVCSRSSTSAKTPLAERSKPLASASGGSRSR